MPNIQVKNVPPEIHAVLRERAAQKHQSLQEYVLETLIQVARVPTNAEIFERYRAEIAQLHGDRPPITREMVLEAIDEGRAGR